MVCEYEHITVLKNEVRDNIYVHKNTTIIDATAGTLGHTIAIAEKYKNIFSYIAIDADENSLNHYINKQNKIINKYKIKCAVLNFKNIKKINTDTDISNIIFDLGISTYQLLNSEYGFSFKTKGPLDMRIDRNTDMTALDIIQTYDKQKLKKILYEYTQERFANIIADAINKNKNKIKNTTDLASLIEKTVPQYSRKRHPAVKTFMALRIEVNNELINLEKALTDSIDILMPKGRLLVITFHSTEDHLVKKIFQKFSNPCMCPHMLPCICGENAKTRIITKKPITPTQYDISINPSARSAQLRIIEKL